MSEVAASPVSDSINPNVNVTSNLNKEGSIQVDATGGPLSFEELEEVMSTKKRAKTEKKDDSKEKSIDLTSDTDKGKKAPHKEAKSEESKEETEKPATPPRKTVKAKYNDTDIELDEEALIPVMVDGKEELLTLKELRADRSGKIAWDKKFSELDRERKTTRAQQEKLDASSNLVKEIFEEQDPNIKVYKMAQLAGVDPVQFRQKFFDDNISLLEKYYTMSEDERKADALEYEKHVHKHRADTLEKSIKDKQEYDSLRSEVNQLRASHQVSEPEFAQRFDQLQEAVKSGRLAKEDLNPQFIVESVVKDRMWNAAEEKLQSLNLGWPKEVASQKLFKLITEAHKMGYKPEDMAGWVDELWGVKNAQSKIAEKKKANEEFLSGKKEVAQSKPQVNQAIFFDEM